MRITDLLTEIEKKSIYEVPAVICTAGSYISAANSHRGEWNSTPEIGARLYDYMAPFDALCFEAHYAHSEDSILAFPLKCFFGFNFGYAYFTTLAGRRFGAVLLFKNKKAFLEWEKDRAKLSDSEYKIMLLPYISTLSSLSDFDTDKNVLFDLKGATYSTVKNVMNSRTCEGFSVFVTQNTEMEKTSCMPEGIPLSAYVQMLVNMLLVMGTVSDERSLEIRLCRYSICSEVRVTTEIELYDACITDIETLIQLYPAVNSCLSACRYVAGLYNSELTVIFENGRLTLVLSLKEREYDDTDFKSRDPLSGFADAFSFAYEYSLLCLSSYAEQ